MKILVACEESQAVTIELRKLGHEAYSCDLQPCSGGHPEWHIKGNVFEVLNRHEQTKRYNPFYCVDFYTQDLKAHEKPFKWDMIIAHPPCTYLTNGGAVRMYPKKGVVDEKRLEKAMEAKEFFMAFYNADCDRIAIENPMPMSIVGLPEKSQVIQPYEYGDPFSKRTYLWLKGLPQLKPTNVLTEYQPFINGGGGRLNKPNYKDKEFANGSKNRSKTFNGIAKALAEQFGGDIRNERINGINTWK